MLDGYLGEGGDDPLSPSHLGYNAYLENIKSKYQGYIHKLFQKAQSVFRTVASFQDIADLMNSKPATPGEDHLTILVYRKQVATLFLKIKVSKVSQLRSRY